MHVHGANEILELQSNQVNSQKTKLKLINKDDSMNRKHEWRKFGIELQQSLILYSFPEEMEQIPIWLAYYFNAQQKIGCPIIFWTLIFVEMSWIQRFTGIPQISEISPFQLTFLTSINSYKPGISSDFNRVSKFGTHWDKWIAFKKIKLTLQQQYLTT